MIDRSKVNQALAKAIAFKQCGRDAQALTWARELIRQLECAEILDPECHRTINATYTREETL